MPTKGVKLTETELAARVKKLAHEMFGWELKAPVRISTRFTRSWGRYYWRRTPKRRLIKVKQFKFASRLVGGDYPLEEIDKCIKHELIHWYTDVTEGTPCHHNHKWKANCRRFGVIPSRFNSYKKADLPAGKTRASGTAANTERLRCNHCGRWEAEGQALLPTDKSDGTLIICRRCAEKIRAKYGPEKARDYWFVWERRKLDELKGVEL